MFSGGFYHRTSVCRPGMGPHLPDVPRTGPKTARGKARASRNAVRHGLSAARVGDALLSAEAVRMASFWCV